MDRQITSVPLDDGLPSNNRALRVRNCLDNGLVSAAVHGGLVWAGGVAVAVADR